MFFLFTYFSYIYFSLYWPKSACPNFAPFKYWRGQILDTFYLTKNKFFFCCRFILDTCDLKKYIYFPKMWFFYYENNNVQQLPHIFFFIKMFFSYFFCPNIFINLFWIILIFFKIMGLIEKGVQHCPHYFLMAVQNCPMDSICFSSVSNPFTVGSAQKKKKVLF